MNRLASAIEQPVVIAIAHDSEDPGPRIATLVSVETAIGAKEGFLHNVLRGVGVAAEEAGKIVGGVELGDDVALKSRQRVIGAARPRWRRHAPGRGFGGPAFRRERGNGAMAGHGDAKAEIPDAENHPPQCGECGVR